MRNDVRQIYLINIPNKNTLGCNTAGGVLWFVLKEKKKAGIKGQQMGQRCAVFHLQIEDDKL